VKRLFVAAIVALVACSSSGGGSSSGDTPLPDRDTCTAELAIEGDVALGETLSVRPTTPLAADEKEVRVTAFEARFVQGTTTIDAPPVDLAADPAKVTVPPSLAVGPARLRIHRVSEVDRAGVSSPRILDLCSDLTIAPAIAALELSSAATPLQPDVAPDSMALARGAKLAASSADAPGTPLPEVLADASITIRDAAGVDHPAPLFSVKPEEIVFLVPADVALGASTVSVRSGTTKIARGTVAVDKVAPGIFTAGRAPGGPPAAYITRDKSGVQTQEDVAKHDDAQNTWVPLPIDVVDGTVVIVLTTTGLRARSSLAGVTATVGGAPAPVLYAGPYPTFVGADQLNVQLPPTLAGRGAVTLGISVDGSPSNLVDLLVK
jgi:uncharacterized protein (TIGR03437 family)